jgi:predicted Rossmann fold nucleotide-binding protein DprA/Smf involved in DNA uptake
LKEGALLIDCVEDVIEELAPQLQGQISKGITPRKGASGAEIQTLDQPKIDSNERLRGLESSSVNQAKTIISSLKEDQRLHVDAIIEASGLDAQTVLRLLLEMELHGIVAQHPGKLFSLA